MDKVKQIAPDEFVENQRKTVRSSALLGSKGCPIVVKVKSEEKAEKISRICDHFGIQYIMGVEYVEDLTDLKKAITEKLCPSNVYNPCPCGSGMKYKFCCAKKMKNFDIERFIDEFS